MHFCSAINFCRFWRSLTVFFRLKYLGRVAFSAALPKGAYACVVLFMCMCTYFCAYVMCIICSVRLYGIEQMTRDIDTGYSIDS